jgi:pimeloyl-ACP methyl ester carboxylesterase
MADVKIRDISANGLTFRCRETGDGDPVILLHGFPETSCMWEGLMEALAGAGFHCLAPDQRGYSPGARPADVNAYRYEDFGGDVGAIARAAGFERFHLVGHDWGAGAGWCALAIDPAPVASWTAMSVPHIAAFATAVRDDPDQEPYRGLLAMFTSTDGSTEAAMLDNDMAGMTLAWSEASPEEVEDYKSLFGQPGALKAALNWYRAAEGHARALDDPSFRFGPVETPTLLIWGRNDPYIRQMSIDLAPPYMKGPYRVEELEAGHWLVQEQPDAVRDAILGHLEQNPI